MAQISVTGTADQIRRLAKQLEAAAEESPNPKSITVTLDNGVTNSALSVTSPSGKQRNG